MFSNLYDSMKKALKIMKKSIISFLIFVELKPFRLLSRVCLMFFSVRTFMVNAYPYVGDITRPLIFGDIVWIPVDLTLGGCHVNADGNWVGETHPSIVDNINNIGNVARFYVKKRRATFDGTGAIQYIVTRLPLVFNLTVDEYEGTIATIFCKENGQIGNTKIEDDYVNEWRNCGIVEILVGMCLIDPQVTPRKIHGPLHSNTYLINEAFNTITRGNMQINQDSRDHTRNMVMSQDCPRFARITMLGNINRDQRSLLELWRQHLRGARHVGYVMAIVLGIGINPMCRPGELAWDVYENEDLETSGNLNNVYRRSIVPRSQPYWYFCCMKDIANCQAI